MFSWNSWKLFSRDYICFGSRSAIFFDFPFSQFVTHFLFRLIFSSFPTCFCPIFLCKFKDSFCNFWLLLQLFDNLFHLFTAFLRDFPSSWWYFIRFNQKKKRQIDMNCAGKSAVFLPKRKGRQFFSDALLFRSMRDLLLLQIALFAFSTFFCSRLTDSAFTNWFFSCFVVSF